jgi:hypothetical protein
MFTMILSEQCWAKLSIKVKIVLHPMYITHLVKSLYLTARKSLAASVRG